MKKKDLFQKLLILAMILSYAIAISTLLNILFGFLLRGRESGDILRSLYISGCFAIAGTIFRAVIKRLREQQ